MENPHAERQNVLLQRIIKNADKCTEIILELNHCLEETIHANAHVTAADLVTKYHKMSSTIYRPPAAAFHDLGSSCILVSLRGVVRCCTIRHIAPVYPTFRTLDHTRTMHAGANRIIQTC
ncbi:hypothetical protein A0H81_09455 [Grifola frondosa]|uniref:DASH complex subunit DAD4 n=1 Tax=Grifola frondosa TaxID=5627 RepID=A0A1C7M718_GRIFR|nr:hypothetical protein A0H81_09455 [Grifola frondosa]